MKNLMLLFEGPYRPIHEHPVMVLGGRVEPIGETEIRSLLPDPTAFDPQRNLADVIASLQCTLQDQDTRSAAAAALARIEQGVDAADWPEPLARDLSSLID